MNDKPYVVVAYYTIDTLYESHAAILQKSLERFDVPYHIDGVKNLGSWLTNTSYKPTFVLGMLEKFDEDIVYVDVDAEFQHYPELFDTLGSEMRHCIAAYEFDRSCYRKSPKGTELLSGTLYLRNVIETIKVVKTWENRCKSNPKEWDQRSLEFVLGDDWHRLPGEYCKIFDRMESVVDPVIVHYQASRQVRRLGDLSKKK